MQYQTVNTDLQTKLLTAVPFAAGERFKYWKHRASTLLGIKESRVHAIYYKDPRITPREAEVQAIENLLASAQRQDMLLERELQELKDEQEKLKRDFKNLMRGLQSPP